METKPYGLQSPEQIAKDYGGNKQKIAEAMQMGILDPTAGTLAGMFIDRMRNAAQMEATPQQTVAQQVFAPPQMPQAQPQMPPMPPQGAPAGLGATPQAAAMPAPEAAPMGMAMGGMVPPYAAGGGLTDVPLPDGMFDEPRDGGYRSGGLVAFATGDEVDDEEEDAGPPSRIGKNGEIIVQGQKPAKKPVVKQYATTPDFAVPETIAGFRKDPYDNLTRYEEMAPRAVKQAERYQAYLDKMLDPEQQKARAKEDFWMSMGQLGAKMASTPGSLLQAFNAGAAEAIPGMRESAKARQAEEQAAYQTMVGEERTANKELEARANVAIDMAKQYASLAEAMKDRAFKDTLTRLGFDNDIVIAKLTSGASLAGALAAAGASRYGSRMGLRGDIIRNNSAARTAALADIAPGGAYYKDYLKNGDEAYQRRYKFYGGMPNYEGFSATESQ